MHGHLKKANTLICNITCNGEKIKQVKSFKYLGYTITQNGKSDAEIKKRIAMAKETFRKMKTIFTNRNININTKINALKAYVWSVLLYGCECWTLNNDTKKRLEVAELWFLRRILRISWTEKKSNIEVIEMAMYKISLIRIIRERQMKFLGHICRKNRIEKQVLCGKIEGRRSRGRQRIKYMDRLNNYVTNKSLSNTEIIKTDYRKNGVP